MQIYLHVQKIIACIYICQDDRPQIETRPANIAQSYCGGFSYDIALKCTIMTKKLGNKSIYIISICIVITALVFVLGIIKTNLLFKKKSLYSTDQENNINLAKDYAQSDKEELHTNNGYTIKIQTKNVRGRSADTPYKNLSVFDEIVIDNNGSENKLEISDLLTLEQQSILGENSEVPYYSYFSLLGEDSDGSGAWIAVDIHTSADPPVSQNFSIVHISLDTLNTKLYNLEMSGWYYPTFDPKMFNTKNETLAYDEADAEGNINLVLYQPLNNKKDVIVTYTAQQLGNPDIKYPFLEYLYFQSSRQSIQTNDANKINPKWIDEDNLEYTDLLTGNIIQLQI